MHDWRRGARLGQLVLPASADTLSFVPVVSESALPAAAEPAGSPEAAVVTVELQGARVEVRGTPGLAVLSDVFLALRRTRSCWERADGSEPSGFRIPTNPCADFSDYAVSDSVATSDALPGRSP